MGKNVMSISYTVHIRFVRYSSVTLTLVDRSFSITCSVRMRPLQLPRRLPSPDKHFLHFFCPFGVRYLYPLICDSTITRTTIKFWMGLKFGKIQPGTGELAALECLFQVQSDLPLDIINYGGFLVSHCCPLGYLFCAQIN